MAKKHTKNIHHEYISTDQHQHGIWFRLSNIVVLILFKCLELIFDFEFSEYVYLVVVCAIVGYDMTGIYEFVSKFIGKRKKA